MKREIKFRSWNSETKKMFYDFEQDIKEIGLGKSIHLFVYETGLCFHTLMQFSGVLDKNGNELFEGDIIKTSRGDWGVIVFKAPFFEVTISSTESCTYSREWFDTVEKIGNIYENPELLIDVK